MRHGHALSTGEAGVDRDADRPLSPEGIAAARCAALRLKAAGFRPALIVLSPYKRAVMTAEIAAGVFPGTRTLTAPALCDGDAAGTVAILSRASLEPGTGVLVVGHQPLLGFLAGFFLARAALPLSPAGFARITTGSSGFAAAPAGQLTEHYTAPGNNF